MSVLRFPKRTWIGSMVVLTVFGALAIGALVLGTALLFTNSDPAVVGISFLLGAIFAGLTVYVGRDALAKMHWSIGVGDQRLVLNLPAGRSLAHRLQSVRTEIDRDDIDGLETRQEGYAGFGLANLQRCYALRLRDGQVIILAEDRALGTGMASPVVETLMRRLAACLAVELEEKPLVVGRAGVAGVWGVRAPDWTAEPIGRDGAERLMRQVVRTGQVVAVTPFVVLALVIVGILL